MTYEPLTQFDFSYNEGAYNFVVIVPVPIKLPESETEINIPLRLLKKWIIGSHGDWEGQINVAEELTNDIINQFLRLNKLKQAAAAAAELVCDRLRFTIIEHYKKNLEKPFNHDHPVRSEPNWVFRMEFMALADEFRHLIKSKVIDHEIFKDAIASKNFRRKLIMLVSERNLYTHGYLAYSLTEQNFFIESIESKQGKPIYWKINENRFQEYFKLLKYVMQPLSMPGVGQASVSIRYPNGYQ